MKNKLPLCLLAAFLFFSFNSAKAYDLTVAKDGSGNYTTVQAAINAAPANLTAPYFIYVKNGTYNEVVTIPSNKPFIYLIGESVSKTIIAYNNGASTSNGTGGTLGTSGSGSFNINATDFTAQNITFENTFGDGSQAVAVIINADRAAFKNCRLMANQDTLYTKGTNARAYFKNCYIDGNIDFIFGSSIVLFDSCTIYAKTRTTAGSSYMTAANTPAGQAFGYVFNNCNYPANTGGTQYYLGRPWQNETGSVPLANNQVVYLNASFKAGQIIPAGWVIWDAGTDTTLIYDAEYQSKNLDGTLADISQRVTWSKQLNAGQAANYTMANMFVGTTGQTPWNPCAITPTFCADSARDIAVSNFRGSKSGGISTFNWNISWGMAGIEYDLYRSSNDTTFTQIGSVTEAADTLVNFQLTDAAPPAGSVYYYYIVASKPGSASHYTDTVSISSAPTITVKGTPLGGFVQGLGNPSNAQNYIITGINLVDNITITPPMNFEVSNDGGNTWFNNASPLVLVPTNSAVSDTISVRLNASILGTYSGAIVDTTTGTGANGIDIPVSGTTQSEANISLLLQQWPLDVNANDSAAVRSVGVTASTPTFNKLTISNGSQAATPAYSSAFGQSFGASTNGDGSWGTSIGGPGGNLGRTFYEQFTVTANSGYSVRIDSLVLNNDFFNTNSNTKLGIVYSLSGFTTDSTDMPGAAFGSPAVINKTTTGTTDNYRFALSGGAGITIAPGQTISFRLYNSCGSSSPGRYSMLKNVFVMGNINTVVPVTLTSFTATPANNTVLVKWHASNEINTATYVVERSTDNSHFTAIGTVIATNSVYYSFTDNSPLSGTAYYRLKSIDKDGSYSQSNIVPVNAAASNLFGVYPNPAKDVISIQYPVLSGVASAKLSDAEGKTLQSVTLAAGSSQTSIDISSLADGLYFININANGIHKTITFIKQ